MGAKSEALARQFETTAQDAVALLGTLSDEDWKRVTEGETWTVGVTAHHAATALEPITGMVTAIVSGQAQGGLTMRGIDEMNALHAKEHAHCTRAGTVALLEKGIPAALAAVRGLSDEQLSRSGSVLADAPPMTAEQIITMGLIGHFDSHFGSIRQTVAARRSP